MASRSVPENIEGTIVRMLAYVGALAIFAVAAASFLRAPAVVAAIGPAPAPRPEWVEVERPHAAFDLVLPELGGEPWRYSILLRDRDGGRKDVLSWGEAARSGPYVMVEIYRPGGQGERFIDAPSEIAARIVDFTVTDDVKPAGAIEGKFGSVPLVDFAIATGGKERRCLGFARPFTDPSMQIAGWYCSAGEAAVPQATLACVLDRLTLISAGGDDRLAQLFARAEIKRTFCGARNPLLAATPESREHVAVSRQRTPRAGLRRR